MERLRIFPFRQVTTLLLSVFGVYTLISFAPGSLLLRILLTYFTTYMFFCTTSCFHETAHQYVSHSRKFDYLMGFSMGIFMMVSFTSYIETHKRHHELLNTPEDWELWPYSQPTMSLQFRRVFVWFDLVFGILVSPFIYSRIFFSSRSPLRSKKLRLQIALEYLLIGAIWTSAWIAVLYYDCLITFSKVCLLPLALAGMIQTGRKLTEHLGMPSTNPSQGTRTVVPCSFFTRICSFLNFDIFLHGVHHSGISLKQFRGPTYPNYRVAFLDMAPHLFKNPGMGATLGVK